MGENLTVTNFNNAGLSLGCNEFRSAVVTIAKDTTVKAGQVLYLSAGKYLPCTDLTTQDPSAVMTETITNSGSAAADYPTRVLISGEVDAAQLAVGTTALTDAQLDQLRKNTIIGLNVKELGVQDNQ